MRERPSPAALGCVCGIALSWVASTQLSQTLVSAGGEASGANLFLVWVSTAFNVLLVPLFWSAQRGRLSLRAATRWGGNTLPIRRVLRAAGLLYLLWLGANYLYVRALGLTSASTVTAVFSTTPAVVAVLSWVLLHEPFWPRKVGAVVLAIVGVLCVDLAPTLAVPAAAAAAAPNGGDGDAVGGGDSTALAVSLTAVAALCAGSYKVLLRSLLGETTAPPIALYLSCLGAINIIAGAPIVVALHALGIEVSKRPFFSHVLHYKNGLCTPRQARDKQRGISHQRTVFSQPLPSMASLPWGFLVANAMLHLIFNFLINFGIAFTSPLFISLGVQIHSARSVQCTVCSQHQTPNKAVYL
eukprot:COSAG02_NODE_610_length_19566_cov_39.049622_8_plen_356_part_00